MCRPRSRLYTIQGSLTNISQITHQMLIPFQYVHDPGSFNTSAFLFFYVSFHFMMRAIIAHRNSLLFVTQSNIFFFLSFLVTLLPTIYVRKLGTLFTALFCLIFRIQIVIFRIFFVSILLITSSLFSLPDRYIFKILLSNISFVSFSSSFVRRF